jgi:hypothetical protein
MKKKRKKKRLKMNLYNWLASVFKLMIYFISIFSLQKYKCVCVYISCVMLVRTKWKNNFSTLIIIIIIIIIELYLFSNNMCCPLKLVLSFFFCLDMSSKSTAVWRCETTRKKNCFESMQMRIVFLRLSFIRKDILIRLILIMS